MHPQEAKSQTNESRLMPDVIPSGLQTRIIEDAGFTRLQDNLRGSTFSIHQKELIRSFYALLLADEFSEPVTQQVDFFKKAMDDGLKPLADSTGNYPQFNQIVSSLQELHTNLTSENLPEAGINLDTALGRIFPLTGTPDGNIALLMTTMYQTRLEKREETKKQ